MRVRLCHLYPDLMNLYGDHGNISALQWRCHWRGIDVTVDEMTLGDRFSPAGYDIVFVGGGQDRHQALVWRDLQDRGEALREAAELGVVMLAICGGFQLFGSYYRSVEGAEIPGIGIFDMHTVAGARRIIGNAAVTSPHVPDPGTIVGFENHAGRTHLGDTAQPLGAVLSGGGNDGEGEGEGCVYRNVFGTYLHGALLPKNPHFTDLLLSRALERNHPRLHLQPLDDAMEWSAHRVALRRAGVRNIHPAGEARRRSS